MILKNKGKRRNKIMIMIEQKTNYVASLIRKHMRMNVSKKDEFIYRLAKIAKECSTYG